MQLLTLLNKKYAGYAREAFVKIQCVLNPQYTQKSHFLIFGRGRSGSTLLTNILNSSPHIYCDKEILNRPVVNPVQFIHNRASLFKSDIYGFKLLSYQLQSVQSVDKPKDFLRNLVETHGYQLLFISRTNLLRQVLSKRLAYTRKIWHQKTASVSPTKMKVDLNILLKNLQAGKMLEDFENNVIEGFPYMEVNYENNLSSPEKQLQLTDQLAEYLSIDPFEPNIKLKKISPTGFDDYIENHQEMIDFISKTEFSGYL